MGNGRTTIFVSFYRTEDVSAFAAFADRVRANAETARGFEAFHVSVLTSAALEQAITIDFSDLASAQEWMDHSDPVLKGHGFLRSGLELFVDDEPDAPWALVVRETVTARQEEFYVQTAERLAQLESARVGYEGSSLFPPAEGEHTWVSVLRFRHEKHVREWLASPELNKVLPERLAQLSEESQVMTTSFFGSLVRVTDGKPEVTPGWKTAMTVLLLIYPAAILLGKYLNPLLAIVFPQPWLALFANMAITVALLTWVLTPLAVRLMRCWLDPVLGAGRKATIWGAIGVCAGYAICLAIFAKVGIS